MNHVVLQILVLLFVLVAWRVILQEDFETYDGSSMTAVMALVATCGFAFRKHLRLIRLDLMFVLALWFNCLCISWGYLANDMITRSSIFFVPAIPFASTIDVQCLLQHLLRDLYNILFFTSAELIRRIWNSMSRMFEKYHVVPFIASIFYLCFNAIFVVYIFCLTVEYLTGLYTNINSVTSLMPTDCLQLIENEPKLFFDERKNLSRTWHWKDRNGSLYNRSDARGKVFPYDMNVGQLYRRLGEDIKMTCHFSFNKKTVHSFSLRWMKNGKFIKTRSNQMPFKYNTSQVIIGEPGDYSEVQMELVLFDLEPDGFGIYECVLVEFFSEYSWIKSFPGRYFLTEVSCPQMEILESPLGKPVEVSFQTQLNSYDEDNEDISIRYTVNGKPVDEVCNGYCFILDRVYFWLKDKRWLRRSGVGMYFNKTRLAFFGSSCTCPALYGLHRLSALRTLHDSSAPIEIILKEFVLIPESTPWRNNSFIRESLNENQINSTTGEFAEATLNLIHGYEKMNFKCMAFGWIFLEGVIILAICAFLCFIPRLYIEYTVHPVQRKLLKIGLEQESPISESHNGDTCNAVDVRTFDVLLSHSDEEYKFVSTLLIQILERNFGLRVCFPDRDFKQGQTEMMAFSDALRMSERVLIVLSKHYLNNPRFGEGQLITQCIPQVTEGNRPKDDLVLLQVDSTSIPAYLQRFRAQTIDISAACSMWWNLFLLRRKLASHKECFFVSLACHLYQTLYPKQ